MAEAGQAPVATGGEARIDDSDASTDDEADDVVVRRPHEEKPDEVDVEAIADFDREFAKMLADTTDVRRTDPRKPAPIFDTAVPLLKKRADPATAAGTHSSASAGPNAQSAEGGMRFSLLSKKGGKQQVSRLRMRRIKVLIFPSTGARHRDPARVCYRGQLSDVSAAEQGRAGTAQAPRAAEREEAGHVRHAG